MLLQLTSGVSFTNQFAVCLWSDKLPFSTIWNSNGYGEVLLDGIKSRILQKVSFIYFISELATSRQMTARVGPFGPRTTNTHEFPVICLSYQADQVINWNLQWTVYFLTNLIVIGTRRPMSEGIKRCSPGPLSEIRPSSLMLR